MKGIARELRRRKRARRNLAFFEFVIVLFGLGILLEMLVVSAPSWDTGWLWMLPSILGLVGILWFVAREPTNL
ncbi:MAG TPA: hypothetical protein VFA17_01985 [Thermoplasmata archaeon]|jgi:uncharacterized membrane protein YwaF|nr:hypothetical protein [Thermoplasmata archaeon]